MESHPTLAKRPRISMEETITNIKTIFMIKMTPNRWLCNELVHELCLRIPTAKTSDRILLTARNINVYLAPLFNKKLIYRDAIEFLKAMMKAEKSVEIRIVGNAQKKENEPIVVIRQIQWDGEGKTNFELETNKFRVHIGNANYSQNDIFIFDRDGHIECSHSQYFLRLIAPLLQPIQLDLNNLLHIPIDVLVRFMDTQSDWIDSIALRDHKLNSEPINEALSKCNKLKIYGLISPDNVPKLVHWLTENNNNCQPKKYLFLWNLFDELDGGLALLIEEIKKEFARATSKSPFVVRLELREWLDEFTVFNELTGEELQLRRTEDFEDEMYPLYTLTRSPTNEFDHTGGEDCAKFGFREITRISLI